MNSLYFLIALLASVSLWLSPSALATAPIWKRSFALEKDLARALKMDSKLLCQELEEFSCLQYAHQFALGGHEPFQKGQFKGQEQPSLTTAVAFERVILSACAARLELDQALTTEQRYFSYFDFTRPVRELEPAVIQNQVQFIYRQFYGRNPKGSELITAASLAEMPVMQSRTAAELAHMLCFVIGSQSEFLFY